jgi:hypothetical protein
MSVVITTYTKFGGPLTKHISLAPDGSIKADGSACVMSRGAAQLTEVAGVDEFAELLERLRSHQAISLGRMRAGLRSKVRVVTKANLINGAAGPNVIARTKNDIVYQPKQQALALLDFDTKEMPPDVASELQQLGGFWPALVSVLPGLEKVARVTRPSTSSGLFRSDTGEQLAESGGIHVYIIVLDGADVERFLRALHVRCWLAGLGWLMVSVSGQLLERSIVDRMVGSPERLVFEGAPILKPPLRQKGRRPVAVDGDVLDTAAACPQPTVAEFSKFRELKEKLAHRLAPEVAKARGAFIDRQSKRLVKRGVPEQVARQTVLRQCDGVLLPDVELPFDDEKLAGKTVGDVLANPERYEGETLADPLEGVEYGRCVARIMRRADRTLWIHSFAHGRTIYDLKYDARAVEAVMRQTADDAVVKTFITLVGAADIDKGELERMRNIAAERGGIGLNTIKAMLKEAEEKRTRQQVEELRRHRIAERRDPRPQISAPTDDAPWLPQMGVLNDVLGRSTATRPPVRDIEGVMTRAGKLGIPSMHAFSNASTEDEA